MDPYFAAPATCPICHVGTQANFLENFKNDREWSLYECRTCRVQFWLPLTVEHAAEQYEEGVGYEGKSRVLYKENALAMVKGYWNEAQFLRRFDRHSLEGRRLIDIGCGTGEFIYVASLMGARVEGIDFNRFGIGLGKERFGLEGMLAVDAYEFLKDRKGEYDIVTSFEVIEHIADPVRFFGLIHSALKPGGLFMLSTPNRDRYWKHIDPKADDWDFPYAHLLRWNKDSLGAMAATHGFEVKRIVIEPSTDWFVGKLRYLASRMIKRKSLQDNSASERIRETMGFGSYTALKRTVTVMCSIPAYIMLALFDLQGAHMFAIFEKK